MRFANLHQVRRTARNTLAATACCALLGAAGILSGNPASASTGAPRQGGTAPQAALRQDLSHYLTTQREAEHISAVSLRVTFPGATPAINLAVGTTRYGGGPPVSASALWQVGSNTKAFTAAILLQLEAEGKLSINDPLGRWLPQYPAWRDVTIKQLLNMTSRIPDYADQPAFVATVAADPGTRFTAAQLVSYAVGVPLNPTGYNYSNTGYILAQMIIERVTHDTYADQLTQRIIIPLQLRDLCYAPYTCPAADAARMRPGISSCPARRRCWASRCPVSPSPGPRALAASSARCRTSPPGNGLSTGAGNCRRPAAPARKPGLRDHRQAHPPHNPADPPASGSGASSNSPPSRPERCGRMKAGPSATGWCTSTSPAPA